MLLTDLLFRSNGAWFCVGERGGGGAYCTYRDAMLLSIIHQYDPKNKSKYDIRHAFKDTTY